MAPQSPTTSEVLAILRRRGKVYVPVLVPNDVVYVQAVKADVIGYLEGNYSASDDCPWYVLDYRSSGNPNDVYLGDVSPIT